MSKPLQAVACVRVDRRCVCAYIRGEGFALGSRARRSRYRRGREPGCEPAEAVAASCFLVALACAMSSACFGCAADSIPPQRQRVPCPIVSHPCVFSWIVPRGGVG